MVQDWELKVDLGRQLKFPETVTITSLRPDLVLISEASEQVILLELTVPWEDCIEEASERKRAKYTELVEECRSNGWRARCEPIESVNACSHGCPDGEFAISWTSDRHREEHFDKTKRAPDKKEVRPLSAAVSRAMHLQQRWQELKERELTAKQHNRQLLQQFEEAQDTLREMITLTAAMKTIRMEYERYLEESSPRWKQQLKEKTQTAQKKHYSQNRHSDYSTPHLPYMQPHWQIHPQSQTARFPIRAPYQPQSSFHVPSFLPPPHPFQPYPLTSTPTHHHPRPRQDPPGWASHSDYPWSWTVGAAAAGGGGAAGAVGIPSGSEALWGQLYTEEPPPEMRVAQVVGEEAGASRAPSSKRERSGSSRSSHLSQELDIKPVRLSGGHAESSESSRESSQASREKRREKRGGSQHSSSDVERCNSQQSSGTSCAIMVAAVTVAQSSESDSSSVKIRTSSSRRTRRSGGLAVGSPSAEKVTKERTKSKGDDSSSPSTSEELGSPVEQSKSKKVGDQSPDDKSESCGEESGSQREEDSGSVSIKIEHGEEMEKQESSSSEQGSVVEKDEEEEGHEEDLEDGKDDDGEEKENSETDEKQEERGVEDDDEASEGKNTTEEEDEEHEKDLGDGCDGGDAEEKENSHTDEEQEERGGVEDDDEASEGKSTSEEDEEAGAEDEAEEESSSEKDDGEEEQSDRLKNEDSENGKKGSASSQDEEVDEDESEGDEDKMEEGESDEGEEGAGEEKEEQRDGAEPEDEEDSDDSIILPQNKSKKMHIIQEEAREDDEEDEEGSKTASSSDDSNEGSDEDDVEHLLAPQEQSQRKEEKDLKANEESKAVCDNVMAFQVKPDKSKSDHQSDSDEFDDFYG
ncbi:protein starmaker-like [Epinephelus fuscoguttatus]|uniref:protein starmaker-like n=1 Tax=Epinephelus fuscoguttatus TaxID=293821 RepID=UPI0020D11529|nr:protein starmaker-like [Epinephelus fuscoguttatus]